MQMFSSDTCYGDKKAHLRQRFLHLEKNIKKFPCTRQDLLPLANVAANEIFFHRAVHRGKEE